MTREFDVEGLIALVDEFGVSDLRELHVEHGSVSLTLAASPGTELDALDRVASSARGSGDPDATPGRIASATSSGVVVPAPILGIVDATAGSASEAVSPGDVVERGQVLVHLRVAGRLVPIEAPSDGRFDGLLVADGELVEYGQPLLEMTRQEESHR